MRITTYKSCISENQINYLVKEASTNYPSLKKLDKPENTYEVMKNVFCLHESAEEMVYMICVNARNIPTAFFLISKGTVNATLISPREVFIQALLSSAVGIILCHNHPAGDTSPSRNDIMLTQKIKNLGELLNVKLLDHIIIGTDSYFSFWEKGML